MSCFYTKIVFLFVYLCMCVDTGGGGPLNVQRFIKELIAAGAKGVFLEVILIIIHHQKNIIHDSCLHN